METTTTTGIITKELRKHIQNILNRRGARRHLAIEQLIDTVRQYVTRQGVIIEEFKLKALKSEGNLTEMKVNSIVETNYKEKCTKLELEIASDKRLIAKYKKHFQHMEEEITELKKKLGIPILPWYEQGKDDPVET